MMGRIFPILPDFFMPRYRFKASLCLIMTLTCSLTAFAQTAAKTPANDPAASVQRSLKLAKSGHCKEALPLLKKGISAGSTKDERRDVGFSGVRCAMFLDQPDSALDFLRMLNREFPADPDVMYLSVHTYSDLSTRASAELATKAGNSYQAHELNAEAFEVQGKWQDAEKEYRWVLEKNPKLPGIHFRIGRLLLSIPNPPADVAEKAKKEFEEELAIDPTNAGAEYVLGELDRQGNSYPEAIQHFTKATKLDPSFAAAYLGLGVSLLSEKNYSDAIPPLEAAVKLQPGNPAGHYNLATAYTRAGRKSDADREFAIHSQMMQRNGGQAAPADQQQ
jgi:tetratricopeptide (TPR) repeat protein